MRLGVIWGKLAAKGAAPDLSDIDRNGLLSGTGYLLETEPVEPDWRPQH